MGSLFILQYWNDRHSDLYKPRNEAWLYIRHIIGSLNNVNIAQNEDKYKGKEAHTNNVTIVDTKNHVQRVVGRYLRTL